MRCEDGEFDVSLGTQLIELNKNKIKKTKENNGVRTQQDCNQLYQFHNETNRANVYLAVFFFMVEPPLFLPFVLWKSWVTDFKIL